MKIMQRILILLFVLILSITESLAFELVLPKEKKSIVNTNYAFFVGKTRRGESLTIDNEIIHTASNGAFAHSVKLKEGENRVILRAGFNTVIYNFYKPPKTENIKPKLEEFEPQLYTVLNDNTPLRSTPVDYGMNRMSHLFKDTNLIIDGQKGDFYRVILSKNKEGWIAKDVVKPSENIDINPKFITMNSETFKNASIHTIEFTEKLPYTIEENNSEILFKVYNPSAKDDSVYTINIKKPEKYSYKTLSSDGIYVFKVNAIPYCENKSLEGFTITIDAGHGGSELGAIGCLGDKEKDINLLIANELKDILCQMGANVIMTRECDAFISLADRVSTAQKNCTNIFVSIHLNSIPDIKMDIHKNRGTSVYYYNPNSKDLAKSVLDSVTSIAGTRDDGVRTASFAVIRPTDYLGILVETAYMTNPFDSVMYKSIIFPRNAAKGIAEGILNYVTSKK